jgi:ribosomal protein S18 acetylase RimI-like enzyme
MNLIRIEKNDMDRLAPLMADFRVTLNGYRGLASRPRAEAAREEIEEFLSAGFPIYAVEDGVVLAGYMVCRMDEPCLWVEHLYVREAYRRKGVATLLFEKAEDIARAMGEDTVFNFVHPNNTGMIAFLRSKGYTVLNMIEIRKPYPGETLTTTIPVGDAVFDY